MDKLKIALLQISPCGSLEKNLKKGIEYCRKAKEMNADIALFPEMWSIGYDIYERPAHDWKKDAISIESDFITSFGKLAKELNMAIGITLLEEFKNAPRNSLVLFDRFGEQKFVYAKVHTCDFSAEKDLTPGEEFFVSEIDTVSCGTIKVGAMICFDREFPESARLLMLKGAEVILAPNACPMEVNRLSALRARAYENMLAVATCNYPESVPVTSILICCANITQTRLWEMLSDIRKNIICLLKKLTISIDRYKRVQLIVNYLRRMNI